MMRRLILAATAAMLLAAPALAEESQAMRVVNYDPQKRTVFIGNPGISTVLTFAPDAAITRVIFGTEGFWDAPTAEEIKEAPLGNALPLWAKKEGRTTLQVITRQPGSPDIVHQFVAIVRAVPDSCAKEDAPPNCQPDPEDPGATVGLTFRYPAQEQAVRTAADEARRRANAERVAAQREAAITAQARDRLRPDAANGPARNWAFSATTGAAR